VLVEEELSGFSPSKDTALTIGVFDGVHLGHKHLISRLLEQSRHDNLLSVVVTFRQHPEEMLSPRKKLPFLTDIDERVGLLKDAGVDFIVPLSFTGGLAKLTAPEFVNLLQKYLRMRSLVIGPDFALGKGREGNVSTLKTLGSEMNFTVTVVPPLVFDGEIVSSTTIRKALADGNMDKYRRFTGRDFTLHGMVIAGTGRGQGLGFPTANIAVSTDHALPPDGVYASRAHIDGRTYSAMTNVGKCPTFGVLKRTIETHLIDYHGDLYGKELKVDIVTGIRHEKKFDSVEALKNQIAEDILRGRTILNTNG
jgi:riboflavin kinase / FMN adenylyltransferase